MSAPSIQHRIVVAGIAVDGTRILLMKRKEGLERAGEWEFPGGKVQEGETFRAALARELKEELDLPADIGSLIATGITWNADTRIRILGFRIEFGKEPKSSRDHDEIRWFVPSELEHLNISPGDLDIAVNVLSQDLEIARVEPAGIARMMGVIYFLVGVVMVFAVLVLKIGPQPPENLSGPGRTASVLAMPLIYAFIGGCSAAFFAFIYNSFSRWLGGLQMKTVRR